MVTDCIFCRIVAGDIPCHKIYQDDCLLGFLDINPFSPGHSLLIPQTHYARLSDCPDDVLALLAQKLVPVAQAIIAEVGVDSYNVLCNNGRAAGQLVDHVHFHIIPRVPGDGAVSHGRPGKVDDEQMQRLAVAIRNHL